MTQEEMDQPESNGTPIWIWDGGNEGEMFEDYAGAYTRYEIRVPVGWSLVSTESGIVLRNVFGVEVFPQQALQMAQHAKMGFRVSQQYTYMRSM